MKKIKIKMRQVQQGKEISEKKIDEAFFAEVMKRKREIEVFAV